MMTVDDWAKLILTILSILTIIGGSIRWLVKHYLNELKPNSGSSLKDSVDRLEQKTDKLMDLLLEHFKDHSKK
jgi:hypothetical protein